MRKNRSDIDINFLKNHTFTINQLFIYQPSTFLRVLRRFVQSHLKSKIKTKKLLLLKLLKILLFKFYLKN